MKATGLCLTKDKRSLDKVEHSQRSQQISQHDRQDHITAHCWWWMESIRFDRKMLLALGNHVTLVLAPALLSVQAGRHFYIVPIPHATSLTGCDEDVWYEIRRFQTSLRAMAASQDQAVLFYETVLPSSGFWQTRLEVIFVKKSLCFDAPFFFKTALAEQAEEWGTHQKLMQTGHGKDLLVSIPRGFDYFYIEYGPNSEGYVQMIENKSFPKDFGADVILGMLHKDPMRFRSNGKMKSKDEEKKLTAQFLTRWKDYDWTVELDA